MSSDHCRWHSISCGPIVRIGLCGSSAPAASRLLFGLGRSGLTGSRRQGRQDMEKRPQPYASATESGLGSRMVGIVLAATLGIAAGRLATVAQAQDQQQTGTAAESGNKPNILMIMADDIGWLNVSAYNLGMMGLRDTEHRPHRRTRARSSPTGTASRAAPLGNARHALENPPLWRVSRRLPLAVDRSSVERRSATHADWRATSWRCTRSSPSTSSIPLWSSHRCLDATSDCGA